MEWNPVDNGNPRFSGKYLVSTAYEAVAIRSYDTQNGWSRSNGQQIIAWMDIPEPYVSERVRKKRRRYLSKYDGLEDLE